VHAPPSGIRRPDAIVREDVGRHNGATSSRRVDAQGSFSGSSGVVLMTSRVSVELVQKAARIGASVIAASQPRRRSPCAPPEACGLDAERVMRGRDFESSRIRRIIEQGPVMSHSPSEHLVKMATQIGDFSARNVIRTRAGSPTTSRNSGTRACAPASWNMSPTARRAESPRARALKLLANPQTTRRFPRRRRLEPLT